MVDLRRFLPLSLVLAALSSVTAPAQETAPRPVPAPEPPALSTAPVVIDGIELFRVRGVSAYPAEERARRIQDAIRKFASDRSLPVESLSVEEMAQGSWVVGGGQRLFGIVDADAEVEGISRPVLAEVYRRRVMEAVTGYRHDREPAQLRRNIFAAIVATVAFALFITLGGRAWRWLRDRLHARYRARVHDVSIQSMQVVRGEHLWMVLQYIARFATLIIAALAAYTWLSYVLLMFPWSRGFGQDLAGMLYRPLATMGSGLIAFIPDLVFLVILALTARFAIRFNRVFWQRVARGQVTVQGFDSEWSQATEKILRFAIVVFALIIAYPYIPGSGSEAFKGIGLILGLMFSLGSPSVIGNLVAGLSLAFRRAFRLGDRVKIGDHLGYVSDVRLLTTYLRSVKNEQIVIPNSIILNSEVVNYSTLSKDRGVIVHSSVGIGYDTPWRQVEAMLLEAARRTDGIVADPKPFVLRKKLGDFAVEYEINGYCHDTDRMGLVYSAMNGNVLDVFNENGVQIMTPAYEGDPEQLKVVPRDQWYAAPAAPGERVVEPARPAQPADVRLTPRAGDRSTRTDLGGEAHED